jgi:hypothetical protein
VPRSVPDRTIWCCGLRPAWAATRRIGRRIGLSCRVLGPIVARRGPVHDRCPAVEGGWLSRPQITIATARGESTNIDSPQDSTRSRADPRTMMGLIGGMSTPPGIPSGESRCPALDLIRRPQARRRSRRCPISSSATRCSSCRFWATSLRVSAPGENWVPVDRAGWRRVSGHPQAMTTRLRNPAKVGSP